MNGDRFDDIMWRESEDLTPDEIAEGWHFCVEMDGLLLNANDPDNWFCQCLKDEYDEDHQARHQPKESDMEGDLFLL